MARCHGPGSIRTRPCRGSRSKSVLLLPKAKSRPDTKSLPENAGKARLPQGALLGPNDFKKTEYGGPRPAIGRHRYFHKLYALDITLDLRGATKSQIERAMRGHILANAELIGTYQKGDR